MNLTHHYNELLANSLLKIKTDNCQVDNLIDSPDDNRYGITVIIRLNNDVKSIINRFIDDLKAIEPNQYYYPLTDMHITLLSIISCYSGFKLNTIHVPDYIDIIQKCLPINKTIEIGFKGITMSPSCVMIQGFPVDNTLNEIRENLRLSFRNTNLEQSIDKRYSLQTAHSTVVRFRKPLLEKEKFLKVIDKYRNFSFGSMSTNAIELVFNDWYQRKHTTNLLKRFYM